MDYFFSVVQMVSQGTTFTHKSVNFCGQKSVLDTNYRFHYTESPLQALRIKLPITLSDEQTKIRTTIKSPDAEKICPFSASEIQKSEDGGQSVIDDISIAIDNIEIVYFVKYYDKVIGGEKTRRYVVLKTYTLDEVQPVAVEDALEIPKDDVLTPGSSHIGSTSHTVTSPSSHKKTESQVAFFTPTTKRVLEEVGQECGLGEGNKSETATSKRTINTLY